VITGNIQPFCYAQGMTYYLYQQEIRIFDYVKFAGSLRERIRENAEELAQTNGVEVEFTRSGKKDFRKENRIQQILISQVGCISLGAWKPVSRIVPGKIK
jgi:hypothetical protein